MVVDPSHRCLGLTLPGTAEVSGLAAEREKGNVRSLGAGETAGYDLAVGGVVGEAAVGRIREMIGKTGR